MAQPRDGGDGGIGLHLFAVGLVICTWCLIWAGALVTSTESGLAVPDWPLSYGMLMPPMVGGIFYEHGHRMVATLVGLLTTILALWARYREPRPWVRRLALGALLMVITQGVLGGITVLYFLPAPISVLHATLAQTFFCVAILLAFATSREGKEGRFVGRAGASALGRAAIAVTGVVYLQLVLGAVVRHTGSALAIPDFPLAFGGLLPPLEEGRVVVHFAHRLGAVVAAGGVAWLLARTFRHHRRDPRLLRPAMALAGLVIVQVLLGGAVVWTARAVWAATAHVAISALVLATAWFLTLRAHRQPIPASAGS